MTDMLKPLIRRLADGEVLDRGEMETCFDTILEGSAGAAQIAAFLTALKMRGKRRRTSPPGPACCASVL